MDKKQLEQLFSADQQPQAQTSMPDQQAQPQQAQTQQPQAQQQPQQAAPQAPLQVDPQAAQSFMGAVMQGLQLGAGGTPQAAAPTPPQEFATGPNATDANKLDVLTAAGTPFITGGLKSVFETKDFLFGDTPVERQSAFRQGTEQLDGMMKEDHPVIAGLSSGIGQFAVAMFGLGKLAKAAQMVPKVAEGVAAVEAYKGGTAALEAAKAATAGAIAFDPHEQRLSNLIQETPLANPINAWLAADPKDSAAWGRVKNAMESLGMDAAIIGTLKAGGTVWKYLKAGDTEAANATAKAFESERSAHVQQEAGQVASPAQSQATGLDNGGSDPAPQVSQQPTEAGPQSPPPAMGATPQVDGQPHQQATAQSEVAGGKLAVTFNANDLFGKPMPTDGRPYAPTKPGLLDDFTVHLENAEKDWSAVEKAGGLGNVLSSGQQLGPDMGAFYDRFRTDTDVLDFMELAVNHKAEELGAQGFRGTLTDEKLAEQVSTLLGTKPEELMGMLQQAGEASRMLTAKMKVAGSLAAKAYQDATRLAMLRKYGDYTKYGGLQGLEDEIAKRFSLATTFLKYTDEMRAQAGRTLRANRGRPFNPDLFSDLTKDKFFDLLVAADANPAKLKHLADPGLYRKIMDTVSYMRISSLISGPKTQLINLISNGYMVAARPLERILGATPGAIRGNKASRTLIRENLKQYAYMATALHDGFGEAVKAFVQNDGVLRPHGSEAHGEQQVRWTVPGTQGFGPAYFIKRWDSLPGVLYNALSIPLSTVGLPTRALGGVDELVKQIVYRSKVAARAHIDGVEQAIGQGLKGKAAKEFVASFVKDKVDKAFDAEGRGLDQAALNEANIATHQQELLPGTIGKGVQSFVANETSQTVRLILPFVKTPTNILRYGWKLTPGLNMLQTEYRHAWNGKFGHEAQAQAVGQMTMGSLFMASAAVLAAEGRITGGGPSDPGLKSQLTATGWRPYSIVWENEDGTKTYVPFDRFDPVALPFGIVADIVDGHHIMGSDAEGNVNVEGAIGAALISLAKSFTDRTYLLSLNQALIAITDPEGQGFKFVGGLAQSFVPFSGASRQLSGDPYMREARTVADKMMQVVPGLSQELPPKYNWLGQPVLNRQGLWTEDNGSLVDREVQRLALEGYRLGVPSPTISLKGGKVDLRNITLTSGENAYTRLQQLIGKPTPNARSLRDVMVRLMSSEAYQNAPDGEAGTPGTRMWMIGRTKAKYEEPASRLIRADKNVRDALMVALGRVTDHYKHLKQEVSPEDKAGLDAIRKGFGAGSGTAPQQQMP